MEDYSAYKIRELRSMCRQFGLDVSSTRRIDYIEALEAYFAGPPTPEEQAEKEQESKTILYFPTAIYNPLLGRYDKGYHLFDNEEAEKWLAVARRVRVAEPREVADYYGV